MVSLSEALEPSNLGTEIDLELYSHLLEGRMSYLFHGIQVALTLIETALWSSYSLIRRLRYFSITAAGLFVGILAVPHPANQAKHLIQFVATLQHMHAVTFLIIFRKKIEYFHEFCFKIFRLYI